ncbi:MAG: hypoxanthine phosphoribosyltransferase [Clostridia bacterium]|nr:hypoxanthine phosphoribosyltransferase [Clostridia bacterium]
MSTPTYSAADCKEVLFSEQQIDEIITRLAREIEDTYKGSKNRLVMVITLKGALPFASALMKKINIPIQYECVKVSSYGSGTKSSGEVKLHLDLQISDPENTDLLIIEDIIDSGNTLSFLTAYLKSRRPASVRVCTLLDKPSRREVDFTPDFNGAQIPDKFVVGFGLDFDENYRALPFIGVLKEEIYS